MFTIYPPVSTFIGVIGWLSIGYILGWIVKRILAWLEKRENGGYQI